MWHEAQGMWPLVQPIGEIASESTGRLFTCLLIGHRLSIDSFVFRLARRLYRSSRIQCHMVRFSPWPRDWLRPWAAWARISRGVMSKERRKARTKLLR